MVSTLQSQGLTPSVLVISSSPKGEALTDHCKFSFCFWPKGFIILYLLHTALQYLSVHNISEHVFASFDKHFQASSQYGSADCHIELTMCKHLLDNINSNSEHALALTLVNGEGKANSDRELNMDHCPGIII